MKAEVLLQAGDVLGESPLWCARRERLFWVDIRSAVLQCCDAGGSSYKRWPMPSMIGSFAFTKGDALVVALRDGFHRFDPASGDLAPIATPEADRPQHRMNEGKCDPRGRFFAGSMNDAVREPTGVLYRLDTDLRCTAVKHAIAVPNSLCWSPDGERMYFADTETQVIVAYRYDADAGTFDRPALFADLRSGGGRPDGATVDAEGCLWSAEIGTGAVVRYAPDGREIARISLPVSRVTSLTFGGPEHRTLFVTTSTHKLNAQEREAQRLAGSLFVMQTGVAGLPASWFDG